MCVDQGVLHCCTPTTASQVLGWQDRGRFLVSGYLWLVVYTWFVYILSLHIISPAMFPLNDTEGHGFIFRKDILYRC